MSLSTKQLSQQETTKIQNRLDALESENKELARALEVVTKSLILTANSLEEIAFVQKKHLIETEALMIVIEDLNSLLNPKNNLLKYDLLNEPHN